MSWCGAIRGGSRRGNCARCRGGFGVGERSTVPAVGVDSVTDEESVLRMARKGLVRRGDGDR